MNKLVKIYSFVAIIFLVSCSDKDMSEDVNTGPIHLGPYYNEFLACDAGPNYSKETITEMLSAWQELQVAEGLGWAGVYAPVGENHRFSNGWWELEWDTKESSDNAFNNPSPEFVSWAEEYSEVMTCDIEGRFPWTFYLPRDPNSFGEVMGDDGYFASEFLACDFNEGKSNSDLRATVVAFNEYLDENDSQSPYFFGVYYPEYESSENDFLWGNWHSTFETMKAGNADWEENGKAIQAKFDEISTCMSPDYYDSWELYNDPNS